MTSTSGAERAVPFYCPYCGDEDLRPSEACPRRLVLRGLPADLLPEVDRYRSPGGLFMSELASESCYSARAKRRPSASEAVR